MRWLSIVAVVLAACDGTTSNGDVVGPFDGPIQRYVVDRIALPLNNTEARFMGADLNGDDRVDNQLGMALSSLSSNGNLTLHGDDMIASGAIASSVVMQAFSYQNDETVSVTYYGADGEPAVHVGGFIEEGFFYPNRTRTTKVPGRAVLHLPVFADADPSVVVLEGVEIELVPDRMNGYDATIRGGVGTDVIDQTVRGIQQMVAANPAGHPYVMIMFDEDKDGQLSDDEIRTSSLIESLLSPDVTVPTAGGESRKLMSFAFTAHVSRCDAGNCALATPDDPCFDRVSNGNESGVDCGGSCFPCAGGQGCFAPSDCQSQSCTANVCAAPTCSDGVMNGSETDVDCGWNCAKCQSGKTCARDTDCTSNDCTAGRCS